jgi:hypothetical protein
MNEAVVQMIEKYNPKSGEDYFSGLELELKAFGFELTLQRVGKDEDRKTESAFETEIKTILRPSPFTVKTLTLPSLFAAKIHAALLRKWKNRIKGRDFFDIQWFMARNLPLKRSYLEEKMRASNVLNEPLTKEHLISLFEKRMDLIDWDQARKDVIGFIDDKNQINLWSSAFFKGMIQKIRLE